MADLIDNFGAFKAVRIGGLHHGSRIAIIPIAADEPSPENAIGLVEKYNDTRTEKHPYKAFSGVGNSVEYLRAFYAADGGFDAAVAAIIAANEPMKTIWESDGTDGPVLICLPPEGGAK